jgi:hypothetical protein
MARRRSARSPDRGGDGIPAERHTLARLTLALAAAAGAAGLTVYAAVVASRLGGLLVMIGAVGVAVLVGALVLRLPALVAPALALLGAEYAGLFLVRGGTLDVRAPLYGAAFLVVAELAFSALELRAGTPEPGLVARRAAVLVGVAAAGVLAGLVVLAAAATPLDGGLGLEAVGIAAAVVLVAALGRAAARSR